MPNVAAVVAKFEAADAESAPEASPGAPPPGGETPSGADSASAGLNVTPTGGEGTDPETAVHQELEAKLQADRDRRGTKAERRAARLARERAEALAKQAEDDRKAAADEREKAKGMSWLDRAKADKRDPREVFEEMRAEALKAGTPEAKIEAMEKAWGARMESLEKALEEERSGRKTERETATAHQEHAAFVADFQQGIADDKYATLHEEYDPPELFRVVQTLKGNPAYLRKQAKDLGVALTFDDGSFTMMDILSVMKATQDRHRTKQEQRRTQGAAPHTSPAGLQQPPAATKPTVNGTAARNAGNTISNDLAASRATEAEQLKSMTREQRSKHLQRKYG